MKFCLRKTFGQKTHNWLKVDDEGFCTVYKLNAGEEVQILNATKMIFDIVGQGNIVTKLSDKRN